MDFRTKVDIKPSENKISHNKKVLLIGSCFTENISNRLKHLRFDILQNPFGIVYNPFSIATQLTHLLDNKQFTLNEIEQKGEIFFSFEHHSDFSSLSSHECLTKINDAIIHAASYLPASDFLLITFGSAWVYSFKRSGKIIANCHKLPDYEFDRKMLTIDEIVEQYSGLIRRLVTKNHHLKIIITVSPVRHWRDGAMGNQLSKSTLLLAVAELCKLYKQVEYFPSYEIMMDELRDYRFYADDMLHPSKVAIDYIWERFAETYFTDETVSLAAQINKINKAMQHKPFNADSAEHRKFVANVRHQIDEIKKTYPKINFDEKNESN